MSRTRFTFPDLEDPYTILGVSPSADAREIKRAYFRLVREYPPEKHPEQFARIRAAYETLLDPQARERAEIFRLRQPPPFPRRQNPTPKLPWTVRELQDLAFELHLGNVNLHKMMNRELAERG